MENIIEYLIPLIFILAFVFPKVKKKKEKQNESVSIKAEKARPGVFSKLNKMLEDYYESDKDRPAMTKMAEVSHNWYADGDDSESEDEVVEGQQPVAEIPAKESDSKPAVQVTQKGGPVTAEQPIPGMPVKSHYTPARMDRKKLRNAIIWSEILAAPRALRREGDL